MWELILVNAFFASIFWGHMSDIARKPVVYQPKQLHSLLGTISDTSLDSQGAVYRLALTTVLFIIEKVERLVGFSWHLDFLLREYHCWKNLELNRYLKITFEQSLSKWSDTGEKKSGVKQKNSETTFEQSLFNWRDNGEKIWNL